MDRVRAKRGVWSTNESRRMESSMPTSKGWRVQCRGSPRVSELKETQNPRTEGNLLNDLPKCLHSRGGTAQAKEGR